MKQDIYSLPDDTKITPLKPFKDCPGPCKGHANNWLTDPVDTVGERKLFISILDGYYPQVALSESETKS